MNPSVESIIPLNRCTASVIRSKSEHPMLFQKLCDGIVLAEIRQILEIRSTYGYKRITSMINKTHVKMVLKSDNKKRILRVMQVNNLVYPKPKNKRLHIQTGKVMTLHPNLRWCSDCFEIKCFNGKKVFVIFSLDTCDCEAISYLAKKELILTQDVQSLMIESVDKRLSGGTAPGLIQFLSDRSSIYRAKETKALGNQINLQSCFKVTHSPESNGIAEAFVKTIKRDYVDTNDRVDPDTVLEMIPAWFKDCNENAPHSALGILSPMEYIKKVSQ